MSRETMVKYPHFNAMGTSLLFLNIFLFNISDGPYWFFILQILVEKVSVYFKKTKFNESSSGFSKTCLLVMNLGDSVTYPCHKRCAGFCRRQEFETSSSSLYGVTPTELNFHTSTENTHLPSCQLNSKKQTDRQEAMSCAFFPC